MRRTEKDTNDILAAFEDRFRERMNAVDRERHAVALEQRHRVHETIRETFTTHRAANAAWTKFCVERHASDVHRFNSFREARDRLEQTQVQAQTARVNHGRQVRATDAIVNLDEFERNMERLGIDQQASTVGQSSAKSTVSAQAARSNADYIEEIRRRKLDDIRAKREKVQRQFRMQLEQERTGRYVLEKQTRDAVVTQARLRNASSLGSFKEMLQQQLEVTLPCDARRQRNGPDYLLD